MTVRLSDLLDLRGKRFENYVNILVEGIFFVPCIGDELFQELHRKVPSSSPIHKDSYWNLYAMARQSLNVEGSFWECGVFAGGSASFFANVMEGSGKTLRLFDTFEGMPETGDRDTLHKSGDFANTSLELVKETVGHDFVHYHQGVIPETFNGLEDERIAFAHIDLDIYQSMKDACEFIYPRMTVGGVIMLDDYGHYTCPGAREAVDEYFSNKRSVPLPLITGQAVVFKL